MKLDTKDSRIIKEIDADARQSYAQIGRAVGLSKDAVAYRINALEERGVITGYYSLLDIAKLGFFTYKLMLSLQEVDSHLEKEIIKYLKDSPHVGWLVSCDGQYNLMAVTWVRTPSAFTEFFTGFMERYAPYVQKRDILAITENHSCKKAYLYGQSDSEDTYYAGTPKDILSDKEREVLEFIADDARMPLYEIAQELSVTGEAIAYRLRQLEKKGIIQTYRAAIDTSLLGYQYYNVLFRLKRFGSLSKLFAFFNAHPNIIYYVRYLGGYDIGIDLEVRNAKELRDVLTDIRDAFSKDIHSYTSVLVYGEHKLSYLPK